MSNFPEIIGESEEIKKVFKIMEKLMGTDSNVLITGETGSGKEMIARAIHNNGTRKNGPIVAVNCSALTETLLETELFGHIKGSFTGASVEKKGLFEMADKGTFFMDEIGDISLNVQSKLLRVLQDGVIKKVGSVKNIPIDVRLIAATNLDLEEEVDKGAFRKDLYYRITVIQINAPPLRQRKEDIPLLVDHFLEKYKDKVQKKVKGVSGETMRIFVDYSWPGNVRELEHEIERCMVLAEEEIIQADDVSEIVKTGGKLHLTDIEDKSLKGVLHEYEKHVIKEVLFSTKWSKIKASEVLGITRQALDNKINRYNLDRRKIRGFID